MDETENLPSKLAAQSLASAAGKPSNLVARGMFAVLANKQQVLTKRNDARYRQAREVYDRLTDDGYSWRDGHLKSDASLIEALETLLQLADEGYGKAYFPLSTLCTLQNLYLGEASIKDKLVKAERFHKPAFDWLHANQHLNDPEIWHDLGALYVGNDADHAIHWFQKAADVGDVRSMWGLVGAYEYLEEWDQARYWQIEAAEAGHENAQDGLKVQHERCELDIDDEQVFNWYVWSAEQGHVWAQLFLAEAYRYGGGNPDGHGHGVDPDEAEAVHWYMQAANQGEHHAQLQLGKMFWEGRLVVGGVEPDDAQAKHWLEKSAENGDPESQYELGRFLFERAGKDEEQLAAQWIQSAADQGYGPAQYFIVNDKGITFDVTDEQCQELFDQAFSWYEEHAKFGGMELRLDYALIHLDKWNSSYNESYRADRFIGMDLLKEIASEPILLDYETGRPFANDVQGRASRRLGNELLKLSPAPEEVAEAILWLGQAADLGDILACRTLGDLYFLGHTGGKSAAKQGRLPPARIEPDKQAAIAWYERGIAMGDRSTAYDLGKLYLTVEHLDQNLELAEKWLLHSAMAGYDSAKITLGVEYASGLRLRQDADAAIYWLESAAETHPARLRLAEIYLDGKAVPKNFAEAIKWLTYAADVGFWRNQAMKIMVKSCFDGRINAAEESAAQAWLLQMAATAHELVADAEDPQYGSHALQLAELYELGLGVAQDTEKTVYWYKQSGLPLAQTRLRELGIDWKPPDAP